MKIVEIYIYAAALYFAYALWYLSRPSVQADLLDRLPDLGRVPPAMALAVLVATAAGHAVLWPFSLGTDLLTLIRGRT